MFSTYPIAGESDNVALGSSEPTCPFSQARAPFVTPKGLFINLYSRLNFIGMCFFGKYWFFQYLGKIYPGVLAHFPRKNLFSRLWRKHNDFEYTTIVQGNSASTYFESIGLQEFSEKNGGICSFWMGLTPAIYQSKNIPLAQDEWLEPSTTQNAELFGEFMGTLPHGMKERKIKQAAIESTLGHPLFMDRIKEDLKETSLDLLKLKNDESNSLDDFCREIVADIDSLIPGILDFKNKSLSYYISSNEYKDITSNFFDIASDVISKLNKNSIKKFGNISPFVKQVLLDNFQSIKNSPNTNIIKRYFNIWKIPLSIKGIQSLTDSHLKELGTIIVAIYDTTSLSLMWAISYIERDEKIKKNVIKCAQEIDTNSKQFSYIDLVTLEAIRLAGSNPTALWRKVITPFILKLDGKKIFVRKGTMLWLDRRKANQDKDIFPNSEIFDPENIKSIISSDCENLSSIMSRKRYEINSFSMVNTFKNPRKCPGRLFSVIVQSVILKELYSRFDVELTGNDINLKLHSAMPKPALPGKIRIKLKEVL
jgi:hypothetical protein